MTTNTEIFIPYSEFNSHLIVQWVRDELDGDKMVVNYHNKEYKLNWDEKYSYYTGTINGVKGYIP